MTAWVFEARHCPTLPNEIKKTKLQTYTEPQAGINILLAVVVWLYDMSPTFDLLNLILNFHLYIDATIIVITSIQKYCISVESQGFSPDTKTTS
ncbi:hypothetical protein [Solitalea agri]|uniref:hypothetical protein n=1 Tax=Solitalea TaxID=929509 RepID=UPI00208FF4C2|nr:hypothetical protein [Solitalea agri]